MSQAVYAFLFHYFMEEGGCKEFIRSKVQGKSTLYVLELEREFQKLDQEAQSTLMTAPIS